MKIFGWASDHFGCGYYRIGLPLWALGQCSDAHTIASSVIPPSVQRDADVVIGQRVCLPGPHQTWKDMHDQGKHLVYELDDDLWNVDPSNEQAYDFWNDKATRERMVDCIRMAGTVTVTTEPLAELLRQFNPNVHVIPNYIDRTLLEIERPKNNKLTLGYAGSSSHVMDFRTVAKTVRRVLEEKDVDFQFVGVNYGEMMGRGWAQKVQFTDWTLDIATYYTTIKFDIGIAPLAAHRFNRSKSHIKALEYGALGIPIVASNFGPYSDYVVHGVTGFLANTELEWRHYLRQLIDDEDLRLRMGAAAKELAAEHTIQRNVVKWYALFEKIVSGEDIVPLAM